MDKPTQEQIKEFWEWVKPINLDPYGHNRFEYYGCPSIDLNSLFKWAVPKVSNYNMCMGLEPGKPVFGQHIAEVWSLTKGYGKAYSKDPALALFWALDKVREVSDE